VIRALWDRQTGKPSHAATHLCSCDLCNAHWCKCDEFHSKPSRNATAAGETVGVDDSFTLGSPGFDPGFCRGMQVPADCYRIISLRHLIATYRVYESRLYHYVIVAGPKKTRFFRRMSGCAENLTEAGG